MKYHQGFFKPKNPQKYKGDPTNIAYRSAWELRLMLYFDLQPAIIWWSSEEKVIPYRSPIDNRIHRYFPDFIINKKDINGKIETIMIEVKPKAQTLEPIRKEKTSKRYLNEVMTYGVNQAKWDAAENYCKDRGWKFMIFTESEIFGK